MIIKLSKQITIAFLILAAIACSPLAEYKKNTPKPRWAKEIADFEKLDKEENYAKDAILFIGSSSIKRWTTIKEDMLPYKTIQRGFGGSKIEELAYYFDRIVYPHEFKALVIFIGTNNLTGKKTDAKPSDILKYAKYIKKKIRAKYTNTPVFWIAITPTNARISAWPQVQNANQLIKDMCNKSKDFHFIETDEAYLGADGKPIKNLFVTDQIHLNTEGYAIWNKIIKKELDTYLK